MNKQFKKAVTGGFNLSVSKTQIKTLNFIWIVQERGFDSWEALHKETEEQEIDLNFSYAVVDQLARKGLVEYQIAGGNNGPVPGYQLTKAGIFTCRLLMEAGLIRE